MRRWRISLFVVLLFVVAFSSSYRPAANETTFVNSTRSKLRILGVFAHLAKSHFDVFKPLMEELARRGHDVTVISHFPRTEKAKTKEALPTYRDISLNDPETSIYIDVIDLHMIKHSFNRVMMDFYMLRYMADVACRVSLKNSAIKELLQSDEKFDVIITESFNTDCLLGFVHRFKAPYIYVSSHQITSWANENMINVDNPSYIPTIFLGFVRPMDFLDRALNTITHLSTKALYDYWFRPIDQVYANELFGSDLPNVKEIAKKAQALLMNTHSSIHGVRPHLPNVVEIGGLHIPSKTQPLPKDIAKFLDNAYEGAVYFCLGSMVKMSTMPQEKMNAILEVLGSIPRKVIWKWEGADLPRKMNNVMVRKWLPQFDILNHPNVKCYIGHGGLLGMSEGVYASVPMILIPMYGDQFHNAAAVETRGSAVTLKFDDLNAESLRHALDEIFNNTRYRENAQRLSKAYRDRPATPLETAVWWTEYIARGNGNPYLHNEAADLAWYQRHLIDVALALIIVFALLIYILFRLMKLALSLLCVVVKGATGSGARQKNKREKNE